MNVFLVMTTPDIQIAALAVQFAPVLLASGDHVTILYTGFEHDLAAHLLREISGVRLVMRADIAPDDKSAAGGSALELSAWLDEYLYRCSAEAEIDIVYFLGVGGFQTIRRRRFAASPRPICVTVLHDISARTREAAGQYPEVPRDLDEDYAEQYAIRHSDFLVVSSPQALQWLTDHRWKHSDNTRVQPLLSDWRALHDEVGQAAQVQKHSYPEPLPRVVVCLLPRNTGESPTSASESLKLQTADNFTVTTLAELPRSEPSAEFLILLSAEVTVTPNFVSRALDAMLRSGDDCLVLPIQTLSADGLPVSDPPPMPLSNIVSEFLADDRSPLTALILRRAAWDTVIGTLAGSLTMFDSRQIRQRLIAAGFKTDVLPEYLAFYRTSDDGLSAVLDPVRADERLTGKDLPIGDLAGLPAAFVGLRQEVEAMRKRRSGSLHGQLQPRENSGRLKILMLSPFFWFPFVGGSANRMWEQIKYFGAAHDLTLVSYLIAGNERDFYDMMRDHCQICVPVPFSKLPLTGDLPWHVRECSTDEMENTVRKLLKNTPFDVVIVETVFMAQYIDLVPAGTLCVLDEHNIESELIRQAVAVDGYGLKTVDFKNTEREANLLSAYEDRLWPRFALRTVVTEGDKEKMEARCSVGTTVVVGNGTSVTSLTKERLFKQQRILFMGLLGYYPNLDGILYFVNEIWPRIRQQNPHVEFVIAGRDPGAEITALASVPGIQVVVNPRSIADVARKCSVSVVPLRIGSGTRVKILDSMGLGLPVVSTTIGCEGLHVLDGEQLLIRDDPASFAAAVLQLLVDRALWTRLQTNGFALIQRQYRWDRLFATMNQAIRKEAGARGTAIDASIIIPVYNALEVAQACVESIYRVAGEKRFEVIVVDNGSAPDVQHWLDTASAQHPSLRVVRLDQNYGFSRAITEGTRIAVGRNLLFLNSDTLVTDRWLDRLIEVAEGDASLGVVGPVSNRVGQDLQLESNAVDLPADQAQRYADTIRNHREVLISPQRLVFFCALVKRHVWDLLGGFSTGYGIGTYEDDDFCLRAKLAGYRLAIARDVFVYHHESVTFIANNIEYRYWLDKNWQIYHHRISNLASVLLPGRDVLRSPSGPVEVSVIVARNGSRDTLRTALISLANQTMRDFEVILIDDCRDDVLSLVNEFQGQLRLTRLVHWGNKASALNAGGRAARGRWLTYMLDDDLVYPYHLEVLWSTLTGQRNIGLARVATCNYSFVLLGTGNVVTSRHEGIDGEVDVAQLKRCNTLPIQALMIARSCLDVIGGFDETLNALSGWDFNIRLAEQYQMIHVMYGVTSECRFYATAWDADAVAREAARIYERYGLPNLLSSNEWHTSGVVEKAIVPSNWSRTYLQNVASAPGQYPRSEASYDVLCFNIINWTDLTQRPHQLMMQLAARGHRVFWIDVQLNPPDSWASQNPLLMEVSQNIYLVRLPGPQAAVYRLEFTEPVLDEMTDMLANIRQAYGIRQAVSFVNFPRWEPLVGRLRERFGWKIVYDCLDDQAEFGKLFGIDNSRAEQNLIRDCDLLLASSQVLRDALRSQREQVLLLPNAADYERFARATSRGALDHLPRPVIGFFGAMAEWVDFDLIGAAASHFPAWSFVLIGSKSFGTKQADSQFEALIRCANVHYVPHVHLDVLASYTVQFDVCIMPFRDLPISRAMDAVKIYEYLASGKPVVATHLPEVEQFANAGVVETYSNEAGFLTLLEKLTQSPSEPEQIERRQAVARNNTWQIRGDVLETALDQLQAIPSKTPLLSAMEDGDNPL